MLPPGAVVIA